MTLIELLTTLVVLAVISMMSAPSLVAMIERHRLRAVVEHLRADVTTARAEAMRRNRTVVLSFRRGEDGTPWCYGLTLSDQCDCRVSTAPEACELDPGISTTVSSAGSRGVRSSAPPFALSGGRLVIPAARATLTAGAARFSTKHAAAEVRVASSGRVRLCSPAGEQRLHALDPC